MMCRSLPVSMTRDMICCVKHLLCLLLCALWVLDASAVPAKKGVRRTITLEDGSCHEVELRGDENVHFYVSPSNGECYVKGGEERFVRTDRQLLAKRWTERLELRNERRLNRRGVCGASLLQTSSLTSFGNGPKRAAEQVIVPVKGKKKGLVLLVNFSDKKLNVAHGQPYYENFFNQVGFSKDRMSGSVHDYFYDSSYGQFDVSFDVVGPFTVSRSMSYYGKNDGMGSDVHPAEMVIEACRMADQAGVDFSQYDWDGDRYVDQVFVIYAGYGEAQGAPESTIWPHEWDLTSAKSCGDGSGMLTLDGVRVNTYAVTCELSGSYGTNVDGIGTACHEFSHCLGIPDLYDTGDGKSFCFDYWDLMDSGSYLGPMNCSECPCSYSSYERMVCGWLAPEELTVGRVVDKMPCLLENPCAYILYNSAKRSEYYLLENRQKRGFDAYLPGHGMLITHVDYDSKVWNDNLVNATSTHHRVALIPADNVLSSMNLAGDAWPGTSRNTALTDTSRPAAKLYSANADGRMYMGKPIEDITENVTEGTVSFRYNGGGQLEVPTNVRIMDLDVDDPSFCLAWDPVAQALGYELRITELDAADVMRDECCLLFEKFGKFASGTDLSLMTGADVTSRLDLYMENSGWTGKNLYFDPNGQIRLGNAVAGGKLLSPRLNAPKGDVTILLRCFQYKNDKSRLGVKVNSDYLESISLTANADLYVLYAHVDGAFDMTLYTEDGSGRAYVSGIAVYEGRLDKGVLLNGFENVDTSKEWQIKTSSASYVLEDVDVNCVYEARVRTVADVGYSDWSEPLRIDWRDSVNSIQAFSAFRSGVDVRKFDMLGRRLPMGRNSGLYILNGKKYVGGGK